MHAIAHFKTITKHRNLVCRYCLRLGLVGQGLMHDLSKYSPTEFWRGAKYYQGTRTVKDGRLGQDVSEGCVRLAIKNAKWIYDYIPEGTRVVTYR